MATGPMFSAGTQSELCRVEQPSNTASPPDALNADEEDIYF